MHISFSDTWTFTPYILPVHPLSPFILSNDKWKMDIIFNFEVNYTFVFVLLKKINGYIQLFWFFKYFAYDLLSTIRIAIGE